MEDNIRTDLICAVVMLAAAMITLPGAINPLGWLVFVSLSLGCAAFVASIFVSRSQLRNNNSKAYGFYGLTVYLAGGAAICVLASVVVALWS